MHIGYKSTLLGITASSLLFLFSLAYAFGNSRTVPVVTETSHSLQEFRPAVQVFASAAANSQPLYYVRLIDGQIRLGTAGEEQDYRILSCIDHRQLRQADLEKFIQGIALYSQAELISLLEDFSS